MSSEIIISVRNLCKTYRSYAHPLDRLLPGRSGHCREFHALRDVSFEIKRGETVGIIGRNGSGKSTLLHLICGIRRPTSGHITVNGRISALLELGSGFHPEFTGRENVFMQGAIMGFSRMDMEERFENITAFADIGEFIDQPVKTYSSGMFVRLAFAVAIHIEPDILIIDEALAVGDIGFQNKCMRVINSHKDKGSSILLVSHDLGNIRSLCDRTIYISHGHIIAIGSSGKICDLYLRDTRIGDYQTSRNTGFLNRAGLHAPPFYRLDEQFIKEHALSRYGSGEARITAVEILDDEGHAVQTIEFGQTVRIRIHCRSDTDCGINVAYHIKDRVGLSILSSNILLETGNLVCVSARSGFVADFITSLPLTENQYILLAQITTTGNDGEPRFIDVVDNAITFNVMKRQPHPVWSKVYLQNELVFWK